MCSGSKSTHCQCENDQNTGTITQSTNHYQPLKCGNTTQHYGKKLNLKSIIAQSFVTSAVMLSAASCGMPVGYSAILLPQLKVTNTTMRIGDETGSWIASIHSAATPFGSLLSGVLMDRCGRKVALQIASVPLILGWLIILFAGNHIMLLFGRLIAGLSAGLTAAAGQVLIGEISEPQYRGMFSSVPFASYSFGILLVYALGSLLHWRYVAGISAILPVVAIILFFFLPESPVWLIRNDRIELAQKSLRWLRGGNKNQALQETDHLIQRIDMERLSNRLNNESKWLLFYHSEILKPFIIINIFNLLQILSGTYIIVFYAVDILTHIGQDIDHFLAAVLTAGVRFVFALIASCLLTTIGRRTLAIVSGFGTSISALILGTFLYQQNYTTITTNTYYYCAGLCLLIYVATNTIGFMILPGVMLGELFPAKVRGIAGGLTFMLFNVILFGVAKVFPLIRNLIGIYGIFWFFGIISLLACIFLYLMLPETKGQTLSQIEDYFQQNNVMWITRNKKAQQIVKTDNLI